MSSKYKCPHCEKVYDIQYHNLGLLGGIELYCDSCSIVLQVGFYDTDSPLPVLMTKYQSKVYPPEFWMELESSLLPCECGGTFRHDSLNRCKYCNHLLDLEDIKRQIYYRAFGRPGIVISKVLRSSETDVWK